MVLRMIFFSFLMICYSLFEIIEWKFGQKILWTGESISRRVVLSPFVLLRLNLGLYLSAFLMTWIFFSEKCVFLWNYGNYRQSSYLTYLERISSRRYCLSPMHKWWIAGPCLKSERIFEARCACWNCWRSLLYEKNHIIASFVRSLRIFKARCACSNCWHA